MEGRYVKGFPPGKNMKLENVTIIANPAAGGRPARRLKGFRSLMEKEGIRIEVLWTGAPGDALGFAREERDTDLIVVVGGDGTLNEVANGLLSRESGAAPVAFLSSGTANVFTYEAGLPRDPAGLVELISRHSFREYPLGRGIFRDGKGRVREKLFLLMAGVGWDARVVMNIRPAVKALVGKGAYLAAGLALLFSGRKETADLVADGRSLKGEGVVIANSPFYGGSFSLVPSAAADSPRLSAAVIREVSFMTLAGLLARAIRREADRSGNVLYVESEKMEVTAPGIPIQMDGDLVGFTPASFTKSGKKLTVLTGRVGRDGEDHLTQE
jgi:YegS/Rv2252/BmrU family lipid kinase